MLRPFSTASTHNGHRPVSHVAAAKPVSAPYQSAHLSRYNVVSWLHNFYAMQHVQRAAIPLIALPRTAEGAGVGLRALANSPSNLANSDYLFVMRSSAPAEASAEFFGGAAPLTDEARAGQCLEYHTERRVAHLSCVQAARARNISGIPLSVWRLSNLAATVVWWV
jgi:hypothetical protein